MSYIEISEDNSSIPVSVTIDTDIAGIVILARLCLFANDIDMGEGYDMNDIYSQLVSNLEQYGNIIASEPIEFEE